MTVAAVQSGKETVDEGVPEVDETLVTYGGGHSYAVLPELLDLLRTTTEELKRAHQKSTGVAPVNHLAKRLIEDKRENARLLLDLAVYARFKLGFHSASLRDWLPKLDRPQHAVLIKMAYGMRVG